MNQIYELWYNHYFDVRHVSRICMVPGTTGSHGRQQHPSPDHSGGGGSPLWNGFEADHGPFGADWNYRIQIHGVEEPQAEISAVHLEQMEF